MDNHDAVVEIAFDFSDEPSSVIRLRDLRKQCDTLRKDIGVTVEERRRELPPLRVAFACSK